MKNTIHILIALVTLFLACRKPDISEEAMYSKTAMLAQRKEAKPLAGIVNPILQSSSISIWMTFDSSNMTLARADYIEFHLSDSNTNKITAADEKKTVDGSDNLAIKNLLTTSLLNKEYRQYPEVEDTIQLKQWNNSRDKYWYKVIIRNVPKKQWFIWQMDAFNFYLINKETRTYYRLPTNNQTTWIPFPISNDTKNWQFIIQRVF